MRYILLKQFAPHGISAPSLLFTLFIFISTALRESTSHSFLTVKLKMMWERWPC